MQIAISVVAGTVVGSVGSFITILVYLVAGEVAEDFHWGIIPNPSMTMVWILYGIWVLAISVWAYQFLKRRSRRYITA